MDWRDLEQYRARRGYKKRRAELLQRAKELALSLDSLVVQGGPAVDVEHHRRLLWCVEQQLEKVVNLDDPRVVRFKE